MRVLARQQPDVQRDGRLAHEGEEEWLEYELEKLREYITDYINGTSIEASDLYPIKEFIQHLEFQKLLNRHDDLYSMDMFGKALRNTSIGHLIKS